MTIFTLDPRFLSNKLILSTWNSAMHVQTIISSTSSLPNTSCKETYDVITQKILNHQEPLKFIGGYLVRINEIAVHRDLHFDFSQILMNHVPRPIFIEDYIFDTEWKWLLLYYKNNDLEFYNHIKDQEPKLSRLFKLLVRERDLTTLKLESEYWLYLNQQNS